jgi:transposase
MLALHSEGASARELAEDLGVNHGTILAWLRDAGLEPNGGQGARKGRKRMGPDAAAAAMLEKQKRLAEMEIPHPSTDIPSMLADLHQQLAEAHAFVRYHREATKNGTSSMGDYDRAMVIAERLASRIAELTPKGAVDPATDPSNLEAAAEVRHRLTMLVEAAERVFRCKACGNSPYGEKGGENRRLHS